MALNIDKTSLPRVGQDFREAQEVAKSKVKTNPFGSVKIDRVEVKPDPLYNEPHNSMQRPTTQPTVRQNSAQQRMVQSQGREIPVNYYQNNQEIRKTSSGKTLKRTRNGNPYIYEDKYDHNGDIRFSRKDEEHYDLRMPKGQKAQFMQIAKANGTSFNQMVLRAIELYIKNIMR